MSVHPSRAGYIPTQDSSSRHEGQRGRSHSPPPHQQARGGAAAGDYNRRPSPSYDPYQEQRRGGGERRRTPERELGNGYGYGNRGGGQGRPMDGTQQGGYGGGQGGYGQGGYGRGGGGGGAPGGGADWFESRRKERDASSVTIWPPSPRAPARDASPFSKDRDRKKSSSSKHKSSSSRRRRHDSVSSDSSDSEDDRRRRSSKHKSSSSSRHKSSSSSRHKSSSSRHKSSRRSRSPSSRDREDADEADAERRKRRRSSSAAVARPQTVAEVPEEEEGVDDESLWVEKEVMRDEDEGEEEVGPLPLMMPGQKGGRNAYGGALLRGDGAAMAAFVENDERIPRRGEIGMESDTIEKFEQAGYVMSGSRHRRMNAVRVRKENQVITAEEKMGILKLQAEEKAKRENQIVASFREMVDQKLGGQGASQSRG